MDNGQRAHCYGWLKSSAKSSLERAEELLDRLDEDSVEAFTVEMIVEDLEQGLDEDEALEYYHEVEA